MRSTTRGLKLAGLLAVLAVTQIIGWGSVSLLSVVGAEIGADLGLDLSLVFFGSTVFYVVMGLVSPLLARPLARFGARKLLLAGSAVMAPALALLALADGPTPYFIAWAALGAAGAASLNTAAYVLVNENAGAGSRRALGVLMMATGLSSSIFWPITAALSSAVDWRGATLVLAGLVLFISVPLYAFALPGQTRGDAAGESRAPSAPGSVPPSGLFWLLAAAIGLNAFVTFGFSALFIELLKAEGLAATDAVLFASLLGMLQVVARLADFLVGRRVDEVTTAVIAGTGLVVALLVLLFGHGRIAMIPLFIVLYGLGSGALAVARATLPLAFFDGAEFARAMTRIALPLNILSAVSPPVFAALLTAFGGVAVVLTALLVSSLALIFLLLLARVGTTRC